jgi:nucleotide-binding universal stress UspA family protein
VTPQESSPIVIGVDGSDDALRAGLWAAAVAQKTDSPLHIVHTRPYSGHNPSDAVAAIRAADIAALEASGPEAILSSAEDTLRAGYPDVTVTTANVPAPADEALVELSRKARLIVLGSDRVSVGAAILVGSTTVAVAARSTCPVVAFRGDETALTGQPIVLGVDGDEGSRAAIATAFELADRFGVDIVVVHAWSTRRSPGDVTLPFMVDWAAVEERQREYLSATIAPMAKLHPHVGVTRIVESGKPSHAILRQLNDAQLVVVGNRGRGVLSGALLGSTGLNLLHHSTIPTMICHARERG